MNSLIKPDFVDPDQQLRGLESFKNYKSIFIKGFPDMYLTILDIITKDDKVGVDFKVTMTHTGEFRGIIHTDNKMKLKSFMIWRIADGKIVARVTGGILWISSNNYVLSNTQNKEKTLSRKI